MTLEEALKVVDAYKSRERATHEKIYSAYLRLRERLKDSAAYITREMVRLEYGGNSTGTVSKYLPPIEIIERAKEKDTSKTSASTETASPKSVPETVQKKLDAARAAVDAISAAVIESAASRDAEMAAAYQRMLDEQKAALVAELNDIQAANTDLETSSIAAGREVEELQWQIEELGAKLDTIGSERDAAREEAVKLTAANELISTRLTASETQIATMRNAETVLSGEVSRLQEACKGLAADAERSAELRTEIAVLRGHAANLENETERLETIIIETDKRHERERAVLRAAHDRELADERQRSTDRDEHLLALIAGLARDGNDTSGR